MTSAQAIREAIKRFGKTAGIKDRGKRWAATPESRAAAAAALQTHMAAKPVLGDVMDPAAWPDTTTLAEYRAAVAKWRAENATWKARKDELFSASYIRRYMVGTCGSMFFTVLGEGDSWAEALEEATRKSNR